MHRLQVRDRLLYLRSTILNIGHSCRSTARNISRVAMLVLRICLSVWRKGHCSWNAAPEPILLTKAGPETERRSFDSGLDYRRDPAARGTDHPLSEDSGNGRRFTSTGPDSNGTIGTRMKPATLVSQQKSNSLSAATMRSK